MSPSSEKPKEFFTVNSLVVSDDKIGFKYLGNIYVDIFIADKIGQNFGELLMIVLCTLGFPFKIPAVVPTEQILSNSFPEFFSEIFKTDKFSSFG